jgi:hypothetical protein
MGETPLLVMAEVYKIRKFLYLPGRFWLTIDCIGIRPATDIKLVLRI